ncbi:MAG TPA: biopolymer transporter ExbD [Terriglobia bacterium]|nr:biopolymer transporter ExbD [Terriglobia bacterium]
MTVAGNRGRAAAEINVTPLIDVLLVLIIIFMVITPLTPNGLDALVPQPHPESKPDSRLVVISIDAGRRVTINATPIELGMLGRRLQDIFKSRSERAIFVQADPGLPVGEVVRVIDLAKGAGIDNIGLLTRKLEDQSH